MLIQSTRYLKKMYKRAQKGKIIEEPIFDYINRVEANTNKVNKATSAQDLCSVDWVIEALEVNASQAIKEIFKVMKESKAPKKVLENDLYALELLKMGGAHLLVVTMNIFKHHHY